MLAMLAETALRQSCRYLRSPRTIGLRSNTNFDQVHHPESGSDSARPKRATSWVTRMAAPPGNPTDLCGHIKPAPRHTRTADDPGRMSSRRARTDRESRHWQFSWGSKHNWSVYAPCMAVIERCTSAGNQFLVHPVRRSTRLTE